MKNIFAKSGCAVALSIASFVGFASAPLAVWDGENTDLGLFSLTADNGNSIENGVITIMENATGGVVYTGENSSLNNCTFIIRCTGLDLASTNNQHLISLHQNNLDEASYNKVGVSMAAISGTDTKSNVRGIWQNDIYNNTNYQVSQSFENGTDIVINFQQSGGVFVYEIVTDSTTGTRSLVTRYKNTNLKSSSSNYKGFSIGGVYEKGGINLKPSAGWSISKMAVFDSTLPESEILTYLFPSETKTYTLNLEGSETSWSSAAWKCGDETVHAPTTGEVEITANVDTTLNLDMPVTLAKFTFTGNNGAVLTVNGSGVNSFSCRAMEIKKGVLKQGNENAFSATLAIYVENGGTLDLNGYGTASSTQLYLAGTGAGTWPWALTSSSADSGNILGNVTLTSNAVVGGANAIKIGKSGDGYHLYLNGFTLTKVGNGDFVGYNMNTPGEGTIDMQGGKLSANQWNNLNSSSGDTKLILRENSEFVNRTDRLIPVDELQLLGGLAITEDNQQVLGVKSKFFGYGTSKKLRFWDGVTATLSGNLTVGTSFELAGNASFEKDSETEGEVIVSSAGLTVPEGKTITVGEGVVFDIGTCRTASIVLEGGKLKVKLLPVDLMVALNVTGLESVDDVEVYADAENLSVAKKYENGVLVIENKKERLLEGGVSADNMVAFGEITVAAGEVLKTTGYLSMTLTSDGVVDVLDGCVEVTKASDKSIKGAIYIREGAEWINKSSDAVAYDANTETIVHVYGKLNMANSRWTFGGNSVLHLYGGSEMCGSGDGNNGVNGIFDFYRGGDILQVHLSDKEDASNIAKITGYLRVRIETCNAKIDEGALLEMSGGIGNGNTLVRTGAGGFSKVFLDGTTLDLGKHVNTQARFVSRKGTNTIKIVGDNAFSFCENDSKADPVIKVESGSTLTLALRDVSGWNGDVTEHGWIVNNGTLNLAANGGSRFFRDHIVIGDGASTVVVQDSADRAQILYGGADSAELAQIQLPEGSATISTNGNAEVKAFYLGNDSAGGYGGKGAGISVGRNAVLTLEPAVKGGDKFVKWGAGTVIFAGRMDGFSGALVLNGGVIEMLPDCDYRGTVTTEVEKMQVVRTEMANGNIRYKVSPKYFYIRIR